MKKIESYIGREAPFDSINPMVLIETRDKVNEIVEWINKAEDALAKITKQKKQLEPKRRKEWKGLS